MITSDPERPVIIQGSAGSGKTTVALHRLAWLLHEENSCARAKNTRGVVMNKSLQIYVCATLPSMGIDGVETSTFNGWALSIIRKAVRGRPFFKFLNVPSFVEEIKFSEEILKALEGWVEKQNHSLGAEIEKEFNKWPGLLKLWKKAGNTAVLPRLKDFTHDVKESNLPKYDKDKCLEFLERKSFDM